MGVGLLLECDYKSKGEPLFFKTAVTSKAITEPVTSVTSAISQPVTRLSVDGGSVGWIQEKLDDLERKNTEV